MNAYSRYTLIACLFFMQLALPKALFSQQSDGSESLDINYESLVSNADLTYNKPVNRSEEGMPIGNGTMGSLVWTVPAALKFQLNRVDVFANNSASNNFYQRHTDYCGGLGFVDIDFGEDLFSGPSFQQHLSCYDGLVTVKGDKVGAKVLAWNEQDVMAIQISDSRQSPLPITAELRMLRSPTVKTGNHKAVSKLAVKGDKIILTQAFSEDGYYCGSAVVLEVLGREAKARIANGTAVRLSASPGNGTFSIIAASSASFDPEDDLVAMALKKLELAKAEGFENLLESNKNWWRGFWEKSFVNLHSADGEADFIGSNYNYYLYVMASSSRGDYPTKFNGMLWSTGGDARKWGGLYWGANQSCLYNALFPTNHMELLDPMFKMYTSMYDSCATAARQQWGSKGIFIPETLSFDGMTTLPKDIADEMRALYLLEKPWDDRSEAFKEFAFTKLPFHSRWNWKQDKGWKAGRWHISDKGAGPFGHVTHIFSRGAKIAYQYWLRYEYTQDKHWLRNRAYPMLKGVVEFYRNFPHVKKNKDGKYHIYNVNDNESIWGGHNTVEEISSMRGIFPVLIKASKILSVDAEMRPVWQEFLDNLSPLPLSNDYSTNVDGRPIWVRALPPIIKGEGNRHPDRNTMPVWFFDLAGLEASPQNLAIANATYDSYFPEGINENTSVYVLSKLAVTGTQLGRTEATRYLIPNQIRTDETKVMRNRMDMREGEQTTNVQRLGRAADALHNALCQSVPSAPGKQTIIRVFPAWPKAWNAQFKLLCRGGFLVTSSLKNGEIGFVEILSQAGRECKIRNPWPDKTLSVYRNGKKQKSVKGDLITFKTNKNDSLLITLKEKPAK